MSETDAQTPETENTENSEPRRNFVKEALALGSAAVAFLVPYGAGMAFFLNPLLKKKAAAGGDDFMKVTTLNSLPKDGSSQRYAISADKKDGWNTFANQPLGAVFLSRDEEGNILALNAKCPHAGCFVHTKEGGFVCPCHDANFTPDGETVNNVSPRALDSLNTEVRNKDEVWVEFKNFRIGTEAKTPSA